MLLNLLKQCFLGGMWPNHVAICNEEFPEALLHASVDSACWDTTTSLRLSFVKCLTEN